MSTIDLKLTYNDITRRLPLSNSPLPSWQDFKKLIQNRFNIPIDQDIQLSFIDDDGDHITLNSDQELTELWSFDVDGSFDEYRFKVTNVQQNPPSQDKTSQHSLSSAALIDAVQKQIEKDPNFAFQLRDAVRATAAHPHKFNPHRHGGKAARPFFAGNNHPFHPFGHHHPPPPPGHPFAAPWQMRDVEDDTESSSDDKDDDDDDEPKDPEEPPKDPEEPPKDKPKHGKKHKKCHKHKHHHHKHHGPPPPPHGPPPPPPYFGAAFPAGTSHPTAPFPFPFAAGGAHFGAGMPHPHPHMMGRHGRRHRGGPGGQFAFFSHPQAHGAWPMGPPPPPPPPPAPQAFEESDDEPVAGPSSGPGFYGAWGYGHHRHH
ncbi:hypothetical protein T439DRAFT_324811 [Meredithblackwellia eburnea MCA 4105]